MTRGTTMALFAPADVAETVATARRVVAAFANDYEALLARAGASIADGYPPGGGGPHGGGVSDPTGGAALARIVGSDAAVDALGLFWQACQRLVRADEQRAAALPPSPARRPVPPDDIWCTSCLRLTNKAGHSVLFEPRGDRGSHCRWCYDWTREHGQQPPLEILELRRQGRRITTREVARVLGTATDASAASPG